MSVIKDKAGFDLHVFGENLNKSKLNKCEMKMWIMMSQHALKENSNGYRSNKCRIFSKTEVVRFMKETNDERC